MSKLQLARMSREQLLRKIDRLDKKVEGLEEALKKSEELRGLTLKELQRLRQLNGRS
jgi:hypothetical protein